MPGPHYPSGATLYRLQRIESARELPPGEYVLKVADDCLRISLDEPMSTLELARIIESALTPRAVA